MLRGDVDRLYRKLQQTGPEAVHTELRHVQEIATFYGRLKPQERRLLLAWAKKEEGGIGMIPLTLSGLPMITLIFGPFFQAFISSIHSSAWMAVWVIFAIAFLSGFYVHHRQRAFTALHIYLLEQAEKAAKPEQKPDMH